METTENVQEIKSDEQARLDDLQRLCSKLFFEYGQKAYMIECDKQHLAEIEIKLRNANTEAYKLSQKLMQDRAEKLKVEENKDENN
jgi:hypothetical protein